MKKKNSFLLQSALCLVIALGVISCQTAGNKTEKPAGDTTAMKKTDSSAHYTIAMVNNKKDPSCGMPVTAGIGDTAHYKDYVIGFCSAECKAAFVKDPKANLAAAELKK